MASATDEIVLAEIDLTGCPVGTALDPNDPDQGVEEKYFKGWTNGLTAPAYWNMASFYRVVRRNGVEVLEHINKSDRTLIAGEPPWGDYTVEAHVQQVCAFTQPSSDDPHAILARSGLVLRYQDLRRYYYFCIEGFERFALYRREDEAWTLLADLRNGVDRAHSYHMKAVCEGSRITCSLDGTVAFIVEDDAFPTGKAGVRTNTRSRMRAVRVTTTRAGQAAYVNRQSAYDREVAEASEKYPRPVLWRRIDIGAYWPCTVSFEDFRGAGKTEIVLQQAGKDGEGPRVVCLDMDGDVQWDRRYPNAALARPITHDLNADGAQEFIGIAGERIRVVSGRTGEVLAETDLPKTGPYRGHRGASVGKYLHSLRVFWPCKLRKTERPQDLILRDGDGAGTGYSLWAYDDKLNLRWRQDAHETFYGMYLWFYDVDGDGREEILPGYQLYDGDGRLLWVMEGADYIEDSGGAGHIDHAAFGELDGDPSNGPEVGIAGSDPGFFLVDARTGAVRRHHRVGHAQGVYAGNFRPDLPGLEMWLGDRWGTYGILNLFSGQGERLARFEPDNVSQGGPAVNWGGDGEELLLLTSSQKAFGLYDAKGRQVLAPGGGGLPERGWYRGGQVIVQDVAGDARDEMIFVHDGAIFIYTQDRPYPKGERIYAPVRRMDFSEPGWKVNE